MYLILGVVGYVLVFALLAFAAHLGAVGAARVLGLAPFRWFEAEAGARSALVRIASSLVTLVAAMVAIFFASLWAGESVASLEVTVAPGPAQEAGIRSGDRVLTLDGRELRSFDALRAEVRSRDGARQIEVERGGQRLRFEVVPRDGRIGVSARNEQRPMAVRAALARAVEMPWRILGQLVRPIFQPEARVELTGPVAIVRSVSAQSSTGSSVLMLATLAAFFWPTVIGVHLFDALTGWLFRATHSFSPPLPADTLRLARFHQTLCVSLLVLAVYLLLALLQKLTSFGDAALLGVLVLAPAALGGILLAAITLSLRSGRVLGVLALLAGLAIPCLAFGVVIWALSWLRKELRRRGLELRGIVALAPTA
jgi:hypothetical protein